MSFAGFNVGAVKVSDGSDRAAAQTLDVDVEEEELVPVGDEMDGVWP